ncbi:unnamed protein product [Rotaria magnacalcarata]|uniref:Uncharacterized protein n=1 Tax=Rotaria magnacalcarata TaxID=392030 RepID=A0A815WIV7_9BILA|nr:unnamed protein product [Rotaria magnacalcarata]CAF1600663.1 unnamed protein product [Rotaria magnacalcarata]CAF2170110.1 unnamed protein product [Rotaria magnacalcarata]CAF3992776.1 unnamed protein product [Rotaria magnacalcarata]CAF4029042.1 unnamed protein product [Rotaria magnacalcarata]
MDAIIGFITELTGEKRGPSKHYRRFSVLTLDNEPIARWVFSTMEIDQTSSDENELITFTQNDKQRQCKIFIIGDNNGTSPLLVYDELIDNLQISESYTFTQIKCKKIKNKIILTTTANSIVEKAANIVILDLNDMN